MAQDFFKKAALPALIGVIAAGAAIAATGGDDAEAYAADTVALDVAQASISAGALFDRADLNQDGALDQDEYAALSIVRAELARLNGFVWFEADGVSVAAPVAEANASPLSIAERIRIETVSSFAYHTAAGADDVLDRNDFIAHELERFQAADTNDDGVLVDAELTKIASAITFSPSSAA